MFKEGFLIFENNDGFEIFSFLSVESSCFLI